MVIKTSVKKQRLLFWHTDATKTEGTTRSIEIPPGTVASAIAWHPLGKTLFLLATQDKENTILTIPSDAWRPNIIYRSQSKLRRLVVGPRPFEVGY